MDLRNLLAAAMLLLLFSSMAMLSAEEPAGDTLELRFAETVLPFLQNHCLKCHSKAEPEGDLDLSSFTSAAAVVEHHALWDIVLERVEAEEMPPADAEEQPSAEQRQAVIVWMRDLRQHEAARNAGDPGAVLARRLSNAEYNYTIRDLTGVDIRPTREFPVDPANEAGFDNSGESLAMSPALLNKYLAAAREVVEHLVLKPDGHAFAPHPVATDTDRDKYCVSRIVEFYQAQPTDYADYFLAAWRYRHRELLGLASSSLAELAVSEGVSAKYLELVWSVLNDREQATGPIAELQARWDAIPLPTLNATTEAAASAEAECQKLRDFVVEFRQRLQPKFEDLKAPGVHDGSQPLVLWKNRQYASHRMKYDPSLLRVAGEEADDDALAEAKDSGQGDADGENGESEGVSEVSTSAVDSLLIPPSDAESRATYQAGLARFCRVFPDAFYISERGRDYLGKSKDEQEKGRLLSAGFHSMMGYFRDDSPLYELVLDASQQQQLDALWKELDFIASSPMRQHTGFVWFERTDSRFMRDPEFDFARAEDKSVTSEAKIRRLAEVYLAKARSQGAGPVALEAIRFHFDDINAKIRWVEQARVDAQPSHLEALVRFAERAYRRPLSENEREELLQFYRMLREVDELEHEEAIQDAFVFVLMSPFFCYRTDLVQSGEGVRALTDHELASRLSYFLWSSMPDEEVLREAAAGRLREHDVLVAQTKRMLGDPKARSLAVEFAGNWLDFRRFEEHNSVDRDRFPSFTNQLRAAMYEEPIRFFEDVVRNDRSVLSFLDAGYTFVNSVLAEHYGIEASTNSPEQWVRVDEAQRFDRGGLLPMSVFLTKNAPGLRTSPVKRGYWVARYLLGERIPPPPPNVPELPEDESQLGELTLREALARHRDHASCAGCHERFDSLGLVFESFGPVGERRAADLGGRPVDTRATFPGGSEGEGLEGLRRYLQEHRQGDFTDNLCRKLLSYALGRSLLLSDEGTLQLMREQLAADDHRFSTLVTQIVTSPQFLNKRGRDHLVME